jgi:ubiquitin carboxyl-terminal hydrolase 9/24
MLVKDVDWEIKNIKKVREIIRLEWEESSGKMKMINENNDELNRMNEKMDKKMKDGEDVIVCKEELEVLNVDMVMNKRKIERLKKEKMWNKFIIEIILM